MKPSEMNFFNCKKFIFNHFELSLSCVIGRNLYCYAPSAGCYSPHCSTASCRLETTRNELFQREKVNLQGFRIQLVMSKEAVSAVYNHHKLSFAKPKSCILVLKAILIRASAGCYLSLGSKISNEDFWLFAYHTGIVSFYLLESPDRNSRILPEGLRVPSFKPETIRN